jgi:AcrR family transcriptional regulator
MLEVMSFVRGGTGMQTTGAHRSLKEKQRQEREALILQAAEDVLAEKGYHETSIDEIAARVGIAKGTVYLHFSSKEDLVLAIFEREMQKLLQAVETTVASDLDTRSKLKAIFYAVYDPYFRSRNEGRVQIAQMIHDSADLRRLFFEKKDTKREQWEKISSLITGVLEQGKAEGELDTSIPTPIMVSTFFSFLSSRMYERLIHDDQIAPEDMEKSLWRIYFKGIVAK